MERKTCKEQNVVGRVFQLFYTIYAKKNKNKIIVVEFWAKEVNISFFRLPRWHRTDFLKFILTCCEKAYQITEHFKNSESHFYLSIFSKCTRIRN